MDRINTEKIKSNILEFPRRFHLTCDLLCLIHGWWNLGRRNQLFRFHQLEYFAITEFHFSTFLFLSFINSDLMISLIFYATG